MQRKETKVFRLSEYEIPPYLVSHTDLLIDLTQQPVRTKATLIIKKNPENKNKHNLVLHGENIKLVSTLKINGKDLAETDFFISENLLTIKMNHVNELYEFNLESEVTLGENLDLFGLYKTEDTYLIKAETEGMRRVLFCLDRPDVLSTYRTTIVADKHKFPTLLSNGKLIETKQLSDHTHSVTWYDDVPKPTYLFAIVAGNLEKSEIIFTTKSGREMPIQFYVQPGGTEKCGFAKEVIKKALKWDEDTFGLECHLPQHMIAGVDKYASGASEPTGLNLFNLQYLFATPDINFDTDFINIARVVSHEYFHYWSGDRVTIRDWFNLTLKEGLTRFRDTWFREEIFGKDLIRILNGKNIFENAARPDTYTSVRSLYTSAAYGKGGHIFRMIMTKIGEEKFCNGIKHFFLTNDGKAVTIEDLLTSLSQTSGADLSGYLTWFITSDTPKVEVSDEYDATTKTYKLKIKQLTNDIREIPIIIGLLDKGGNEIVGDTVLFNDCAEQEFVFNDIEEYPVPSLLRSFSAPVQLTFNYTSSNLLLLMRHDTNHFNRWDAARTLIYSYIEEYIEGKQISLTEEFYSTYQALLTNKSIAPWILAEIIRLPTQEEAMESLASTEFEKINKALAYISNAIKTELFDYFVLYFSDVNKASSQKQFNDFDITEAGHRRLKHVCISYLYQNNPDAMRSYAKGNFTENLAKNMTETINALSLLCDIGGPESKDALEKFYQQWKDENNALRFWFKLQSGAHSSNTIEVVRSLMQHSAFDITNPNKVYALFDPFVRNPYGFHVETGEGYQLLADVIIQLDKINPSLSSKLMTPATFMNWNNVDVERQKLMYAALKRIEQHTTSVAVKDVLTKCFAKGEDPRVKSVEVGLLLNWMNPAAAQPQASAAQTVIPGVRMN